MRVTSRDILAVLKRFNLAGDENYNREIEQIKPHNPSPHNLLVTFRFKKKPYFLLFDDSASDQVDYILSQIHKITPSAIGKLSKNPLEQNMTYGLPFKGKEVYVFTGANLKKRLDVRLAEEYDQFSRSQLQKYIKNGRVNVNGGLVTQPSHEIFDSDKISITLPDAPDTSSQTLPILYIDEDIIVIDKPTGILTHAKGQDSGEFTVADFFRRYSTYKLETDRPGVVHRLDRDTSGVLVGARHEDAAKLLQKQFADRKVKKTYLAVVSKPPEPSAAILDLPIGRNPSSPSTFRVDPSGKTAKTTYRTIATNPDGLTLLKLNPETGRTHQLRVHLSYIGRPIVGDRVYGQAVERLYLHATELEITMPGGERRTFASNPPAEFVKLFPSLEKVV